MPNYKWDEGGFQEIPLPDGKPRILGGNGMGLGMAGAGMQQMFPSMNLTQGQEQQPTGQGGSLLDELEPQINEMLAQMPTEKLVQIAQMDGEDAMGLITKLIVQQSNGAIEEPEALNLAELLYTKILEKAQVDTNNTISELKPDVDQEFHRNMPSLANAGVDVGGV